MNWTPYGCLKFAHFLFILETLAVNMNNRKTPQEDEEEDEESK